MIEWVKGVPPKDGEVYLALWKGCFCLASWDEEINCFWLSMYPGTYEKDMIVSPEREFKFTHYAVLKKPDDY